MWRALSQLIEQVPVIIALGMNKFLSFFKTTFNSFTYILSGFTAKSNLQGNSKCQINVKIHLNQSMAQSSLSFFQSYAKAKDKKTKQIQRIMVCRKMILKVRLIFCRQSMIL